jgi:hypothetical protein
MWWDLVNSVRLQAGQNFVTGFSALEGEARNSGFGGATVSTVSGGFTALGTLIQVFSGIYKGRPAAKFLSTANQRAISCMQGPMTQFQAPLFNITTDEPLCWRVLGVLAVETVGAQATPNDNGFMFTITPYVGNGIAQAAPVTPVSGFGVCWQADGFPYWVSRRTLTTLTPPDELIKIPGSTADNEWHAIEFRITGAVKGRDATLELLFDNVHVLSRDWGAGTKLPDFTSDTGMLGLRPQVMNGTTAYPTNVYCSLFRVMGGPTMAALF